MVICCTRAFKDEFDKLIKNNSYSGITIALKDYLKVDTLADLAGGDLLNRSPQFPFLKDRIEGSSGFRIYQFLHYKSDRAVLGYIHPKTGAKGRQNTTVNERKDILNQITQSIKSNDLLYLSLIDDGITFKDKPQE
jgi:hypothetical protein